MAAQKIIPNVVLASLQRMICQQLAFNFICLGDMKGVIQASMKHS